MSGRFQGQTVVVTGGTSGIGLASAQRFAAEGATLFITGRRKAELDAAVGAVGGSVTGIQADISQLAQIERV